MNNNKAYVDLMSDTFGINLNIEGGLRSENNNYELFQGYKRLKFEDMDLKDPVEKLGL